MIKTIIFIILILFSSLSWAVTPKIIPSTDMTYLGAFKLPSTSPGLPTGYNYYTGESGNDSFTGIEYYPPDGSLIILLNVESYNGRKFPARYSIVTPLIPDVVNGKRVTTNLNTAELVQAPVDIGISGQQVYGNLGDVHYMPADVGTGRLAKLYWSVYGGYEAVSPYLDGNGQLGWADPNWAAFNSAGMWRMKNCIGSCYYSSGKYIFHAPQAWADTYTGGKSLLWGYLRSGGSAFAGPTLSAIAPWLEGSSPPNTAPLDAMEGATPSGNEVASPLHYLPHVSLLTYGGMGSATKIQNYGANDFFTSGRWITGIGSKQAIIFSGWKSLRYYDSNTWTYPVSYPPRINDTGGYQDWPTTSVLYFYDVDDITATALGTKQIYEPQPYRTVELNQYMIYDEVGSVMGMAYDESSGKLYLEEYIGAGYSTVIHVFQIADTGSSLDTIPPSAPVISVSAVNKGEVSFTWDAVSDDSGKPVIYRIYRNERIIAVQSNVNYIDSYLSYATAPVTYRVDAVDFEGNVAASNILSIDNTIGTCPSANCGNAPMTIFVPSLCGAAHESSCMKFKYNEGTSVNSIPAFVRGGIAPYTWSLSASGWPTGTSISGVGTTGTVTVNNPTPNGFDSHIGYIQVIDNSGHYARLLVSVKVVSSGYGTYYTDRDQDGVNDVASGGTDTNDFDCEDTPGRGYTQPPPTSLYITTSTSTTVSLAWTAAPARTDDCNGTRPRVVGLDMFYEVYHGTATGVYGTPVYVGRSTTYTWTGLTDATHFFAVKAIEFRNRSSILSNETQQVLGGGDVTAPTLQTAIIPPAGATISLLFDEAVTRAAGGTLTIALSGAALTMTYASGSGTSTLVYNLSRTVLQGETGTITWTTAADKIEDASGNDWASVANFSVTNSSTQVPRTGFIGSAFGAYYAEGWAGGATGIGASIVQASDGGVVLVAPTWSYAWNTGPGTETACTMLVKASIDGVESWRKVSCSTGYDITTKQRTIYDWYPVRVIASGTNLLVVGFRNTVARGIDGFLTKYDSVGTLVWDRVYGYSGVLSDYLYDVVERTGGGFAMVGQGVGETDTDVWLVFTDTNGENWTDTYYNTNGKGYESASAIRKTADGGYILAGYTSTGGTDEDYYACKVTSTGVETWCQKYDNSGRRDKATSVEEDAGGNFWIFGRSQIVGEETTYIWVVKTNSSGVLQASYAIPSGITTGQAYIPKGTINLTSTNFLILGYTNVSSGSGYHGYVTEINTSGVVQGTPQAISPTTGSSESYIFSGVVSADTSYYLLAGNDNQSFSTAYDLWYLKMAVSDRSISNLTTCETKTTYYYDKDLDGNGNNAQWETQTGDACFAMPGYVLTHADLDDTWPGAVMSLTSGSTTFTLNPEGPHTITITP